MAKTSQQRFEQAKKQQKEIADERPNRKIKSLLSPKTVLVNRKNMLEEQFGLCAICEVSVSIASKRYHLDHDHDTGEIRGVLCHGCNIGLGMFRDDPRRMLRAIDYLNKFRLDKVKYTLEPTIEPVVEPELIVDTMTNKEWEALPGIERIKHLKDLEVRRAEAKFKLNPWWFNLPDNMTLDRL